MEIRKLKRRKRRKKDRWTSLASRQWPSRTGTDLYGRGHWQRDADQNFEPLDALQRAHHQAFVFSGSSPATILFAETSSFSPSAKLTQEIILFKKSSLACLSEMLPASSSVSLYRPCPKPVARI